MKFLSRLGQIILSVGKLVTGFIPAVKMVATDVQIVSKDLAEISQVIGDVEAVGQVLAIKGPDKLRAAAPLVAQIILASTVLANHAIANPTLFQGGCTKIADGMADVLNSLKTDNLTVVEKT